VNDDDDTNHTIAKKFAVL